jgi:uncharacterized protein YdeI (YjbR/CyaY-like superfamily)
MINPDGSIGPIGGIPYKIDAAHSVGATRFLIPKGQMTYTEMVTEYQNINGILWQNTYPVTRNVSDYALTKYGMQVAEVEDINDALLYFTGWTFPAIESPNKITTEDYITAMKPLATSLLAQTTLRDIVGQKNLDELLAQREELNKSLQAVIDLGTDPWGIKVTAVTIKDVSLPEEMLRAIAKQAEAEREKRSRIIMAEGELQASAKMTEAAKLYEKTPVALRLRELQTLTEIAREKNLIIVPGGEIGNIAGIAKAVTKKE